MAVLKWLLFCAVGLLLWTALAGWSLLEGHTRAPIADEGDAQGFVQAIQEYLDAEGHGNIALVLIEGGDSIGEIFRGAAGAGTLFPLASQSKWFTAIGVMKLVEDGRIDLDSPVENYLERWRLPPSTYDHDEVTVRRLLSHTAGLTDGLGFGDYRESETVPGDRRNTGCSADVIRRTHRHCRRHGTREGIRILRRRVPHSRADD